MGIFDKLFGKKNKDDTALITAAKEGHTEIVEMLLTKGADVNAKQAVAIDSTPYTSMVKHLRDHKSSATICSSNWNQLNTTINFFS